MDFAAVPGLGTMMEQATGYCRQTGRFVRDREYAELESDGDDAFGVVRSNHDAVVEHAASWFDKAADPVLATTASKIDATIRLFKDTETANTATIDATVPSRLDTVDVSLPPWDTTQTPAENTSLGDAKVFGPFEFVEDPAGALHEPRDYSDDPGLAYHPRIWDVLGPSAASAARATVIEVTNFLAGLSILDKSYDPYEVFTKPLVGDWAGLRRYADVLRQAGDAAERTGIGIDRARHLLGPVWRGRSADACVVWLGAVATPLREAPGALDAMADEYERAAEGAAAYRGLIEEAANSLIDYAFFIAGTVAVGAGGAAATGGVSAGVAAVIAGGEIVLLVQAITNLFELMSKYEAVKALVAAAQNDFGDLQAGGQLPNLPTVTGDASAISVLPS